MYEGVVTYMSSVEVFASGIKIETNNQIPFWGPIKGSRAAKSMDQEHTVPPLTSKYFSMLP